MTAVLSRREKPREAVDYGDDSDVCKGAQEPVIGLPHFPVSHSGVRSVSAIRSVRVMKASSKAVAKVGTSKAGPKERPDGFAAVPARVPVGTTFVLEGKSEKHGVKVFSRYLEFPDGTRINLMERAQIGTPVPRRARRLASLKTSPHKSRAKTISKTAAKTATKRKVS